MEITVKYIGYFFCSMFFSFQTYAVSFTRFPSIIVALINSFDQQPCGPLFSLFALDSYLPCTWAYADRSPYSNLMLTSISKKATEVLFNSQRTNFKLA